ncbi:MAG TPA: GNAT family N-acetyltransferase [Thermomicrobiaceae bacterium]|nr:GNAT family N-acetyltransferase [Thermomicrobiaceae bacterium]
MSVAHAEPLIATRPACADDLPFVLETAAKLRWPHGVQFRDWRPAHDARVLGIVERGGGIHVAEARGVLLGYAITDAAGALVSIYVKRDFRGAGIGIELLRAAGVDAGKPISCERPTPSLRIWARVRGLTLAVAGC